MFKKELECKTSKFENGSNMIVSLVFLLLEDFLKEHGRFPKKLHLCLDNCWKENKGSSIEISSYRN